MRYHVNYNNVIRPVNDPRCKSAKYILDGSGGFRRPSCPDQPNAKFIESGDLPPKFAARHTSTAWPVRLHRSPAATVTTHHRGGAAARITRSKLPSESRLESSVLGTYVPVGKSIRPVRALVR